MVEEEFGIAGSFEGDIEGLDVFEDGGFGFAVVAEVERPFNGRVIGVLDCFAAEFEVGLWVEVFDDALCTGWIEGFCRLGSLPFCEEFARRFASVREREGQVGRIGGRQSFGGKLPYSLHFGRCWRNRVAGRLHQDKDDHQGGTPPRKERAQHASSTSLFK